MAYLIDTNVLLRLANQADAQYAIAARALLELHRRNETVQITPQVLIEFRSAATRPVSANGLGLSVAEADALAAGYETSIPMIPDTPDIYPAWKALVGALGIIGKQVHDARLVAVCHVNVVTHLLTFNGADFGRMAGFGPGIVVVDPAKV